jgi:hypothetical protein
MSKTLTFAALLLASGLCGAQTATDPQRDARWAEREAQAQARFAAADVDKDGGIDRVEARALGPRVVDHFDRVDGNKDGSLDARELGRARAHARAQGHQGQARKAFLRGLFIGLDDDGDGAISRAELGDKLPKLAASFAQIDRDSDGRISKEEMRAHRMQRQAERQAPRPA